LAAEWATKPGLRVRALGRHDRGYPAGVERRQVDLVLTPTDALVDACRGVDTVVHLAAPNEVECAQRPDQALTDTVVATRRLADAAAAAGVRRFVYLSTVHVYGAAMAEGATISESTVPEPRFVYSIAHLASEHLASAFASAGGASMDVVVIRATNVIGAPGHPAVERWTLLSNDLCRQAVTKGVLELRTHGMQWRDFVAMEDAVRMISAFLDPDGREAGSYNMGSGEPMTCYRLAELVQEAAEQCTGSRPPIQAPPPPAQPPKPYWVSVERLAAQGLVAEVPLAAAIEETVRFCLDHREAL
jgi:UDP-glucose 4-epimerase